MSLEAFLRILFVTPELAPFARTGGLGDVTSALPKALAALGHDVHIVMPYYQIIHERKDALSLVLQEVYVPLNIRAQTARVWHTSGHLHAASNVLVYFIEQDNYFGRPALYGNEGGDYGDNAERYAFFCRAVLSLLRDLDWVPDIIHCHDWQTGLLPAYVRWLPGLHPHLYTIPTVFTIHNLAYRGIFPAEALSVTGLPGSLFHPDGIEFYGQLCLMKAGLFFADYLTTVSPTYAEEICTPEFGEGLDGVLNLRRAALSGILNGIDDEVWNPETDTAIAARYSMSNLSGKAACKTALLNMFGLSDEPSRPLMGIISRLVEQKGIDLLAQALDALLNLDFCLVILGTGDLRYQDFLAAQARRHPDRIGVSFEFNDTLAHQIEAGSDCFLMPSRYEPCGLNQMYSLRYGTIPIVRATGGLRDTVVPYRVANGEGTGFVFQDATAEALIESVQEMRSVFKDHIAWHQLMCNAMVQDFSWTQSAYSYLSLYQQAVEGRQS